ncbi:hypothetical protein MHU86_10888 [Fragilaria crotonensis]|nr:hypothetical protein MHU86_10888 [Fragilaria crotonensis]
MGVRPGTVDGRVPQQTPRRTPRTLSESAARDSPAGTHAHEPSRPATSPTPRISPARDDPSRNEVGPERYAPPSTRHRPTTRARALSPGDAHDAPTSALADTPRPLPGKFPSLVPLPTIPLPNVDSPFPRLPNHAWPMPLPLFCTPANRAPTRRSFASTGRTTPPATTSRCSNGTPRPRRRPSGPAVQRPDAGIRVSPHRTSRPLLSAHPLAAFSGAHLRRGRVPLREISDSDRLADVRANLARGNHKSARGHEAKLISMLKDEAQGVGSYHCREKPP